MPCAALGEMKVDLRYGEMHPGGKMFGFYAELWV